MPWLLLRSNVVAVVLVFGRVKRSWGRHLDKAWLSSCTKYATVCRDSIRISKYPVISVMRKLMKVFGFPASSYVFGSC